jgi:outer membrane protein TolC
MLPDLLTPYNAASQIKRRARCLARKTIEETQDIMPPIHRYTAVPVAAIMISAPGAVVPPAFAQQTVANVVQEGPLTIEQAVALAVQNNPALRATRKRVEGQRGVVAERRTARSFTLAGSGTITQYDRDQTGTIGNQEITFFNQRQREAGINASLPLDITGQIRAAISQADLNALSARFGYETAVNNLASQVRTDYITVLRRLELVKVQRDALTNAEERLRVVLVEVREGKSAPFDRLRAQTEVESAREVVLRAENEVVIAEARLKRTMGVAQSTVLTIPDNLPESPTADIAESPDEADLFTQAIAARPETRRAAVDIRAAELGITLARRDSLPTVAVGAGYNYMPDAAGLGPMTQLGQVNLSVRVPIFDGGLRKAREQQARAGTDAARSDRADAESIVALDLRQALVNVRTARQRIPVAEAAVQQAEESYRLARVRLREGVSILVETTDAQTALTRARTDLVNARFDLRDAETALARALGRLITATP